MPNILVNLPDLLLASLDSLAAERAEPGMKPNRTEAVRHLIRLHAAVCRPVPAEVTEPQRRTAKGPKK